MSYLTVKMETPVGIYGAQAGSTSHQDEEIDSLKYSSSSSEWRSREL